MARLTWLADELRKAGLKVVEVDGWQTRGSTDFDPEGVTWHATAGSRTSTAQGEVNVILNGSTSAPPPIAQIMAYRDGVLYICAAGRCNHNKVGWAGPNKGLGNTALLGIEMANDNRGEPWPAVQLDAVRRATAVIMRKLGADPMRRLAAHYEHQPYEGRPPGETSTKSDPLGVVMTQERPKVAAIMKGEDVTEEDMDKLVRKIWGFDPGNNQTGAVNGGMPLPGWTKPGDNATANPAWGVSRAVVGTDVAYQIRDRVDQLVVTLGKVLTNVLGDDSDLQATLAAIAEAHEATVQDVLAGLSGAGQTDAQVADALKAALGDRAAAVGALLTAG